MCNTFKLKQLLYSFRPNQFTDEAGHPSAEGGQNFRGDLLRRPPHGAPDPALMRTGNSTGFEADTSKVCFLKFVLKGGVNLEPTDSHFSLKEETVSL